MDVTAHPSAAAVIIRIESSSVWPFRTSMPSAVVMGFLDFRGMAFGFLGSGPLNVPRCSSNSNVSLFLGSCGDAAAVSGGGGATRSGHIRRRSRSCLASLNVHGGSSVYSSFDWLRCCSSL